MKELAEDELKRIKGMSVAQVENDLDFYETGLPFLRQAYAAGNLKEVHKSLRFFLKSIGLNLQRSSPAMERLARRFQQTELEVHEAIAQRRQGNAVDIPIAASDTFSIDAVLACWTCQKPSAAQNLKTVRSFEQIFNEFKAHCQAPTARLVKRADAIAFRKYLSARGDRSPQTIAKQIASSGRRFSAPSTMTESRPTHLRASKSSYRRWPAPRSPGSPSPPLNSNRSSPVPSTRLVTSPKRA